MSKEAKELKNIPKKIYLQIEGSDVTIDKSITDWSDLFQGAITWADHRINDNDIEFVLSDVSQQRELLADEKCDKLLQDLDEYARNYDGYEYGLPINFTDDTGELDEQRFLIKEWFKASCG